jgi:hypothetical protein
VPTVIVFQAAGLLGIGIKKLNKAFLKLSLLSRIVRQLKKHLDILPEFGDSSHLNGG